MTRKLTNDQIAGGRTWVIAGGWAACPGLAGDQDVWILIGESWKQGIDERLEHMYLVRRAMLTAFPELLEEGDVTQTVEEMLTAYGDLGLFIQKVGTIGNRHFMVTDAENISELLDGFDISTHQCAITSEGEFIPGRHWTPITEPPVAFRMNEHTPARLEKIRARYQL